MGFILKQVFAFIKLLNSDTGNISLAAGVTSGFILGMTPVLSLHSLLVFLFLFFSGFGLFLILILLLIHMHQVFDTLLDFIDREVALLIFVKFFENLLQFLEVFFTCS